MITIEDTAIVGPDGRVVLTLPATVTPGPHRVIIMVDQNSDDPLAAMIGASSGGASATGRNAEDILYGRPESA